MQTNSLGWTRLARVVLFATAANMAFALQSHDSQVSIATAPNAQVLAENPGLWRALQEARLGIQATGSTYSAHSLANAYAATFDGHGFLVQPDAGDWSFGLQLSGFSRGADRELLTSPKGHCASNNELTYEWNAELLEWWRNEPEGLEHGFTVFAAESEDSGSLLTFDLALRGNLLATLAPDRRSLLGTHPTSGQVLTYGGLYAYDSTGKALDCSLGLEGNSMQILVDATHAQYPIVVDPLVYSAFLTSDQPADGEFFGYAVAVSGDTVAIGAQHTLFAPGFGYPGSVYVFVRSGSAWSLQQQLFPSTIDNGDQFGTSVALEGDTLVVGAYSESSSATGVNGDESDDSAPRAGAAYVFTRSGSAWTQQAYLKASNTNAGDEFGNGVALSGDLIAVRSLFESSNSSGVNGNQTNNSLTAAGAVYLFRRNGSTWVQEAYVKASNPNSGDFFGSGIALSGDTLVVGARFEDSSATVIDGDASNNAAVSAGAAYVFVSSAGVWSQQAYLKAPNAEAGDEFGGAVDVDGDTILVGAKFEDSSARGLNGDPFNNGRADSGAAYLFQRTGASWSPAGYWKASNSDAGDLFGHVVLIAGARAVVASWHEDSNALGANGDPNNDLRPDSGAFMAFALEGGAWEQTAYIKPTTAWFDDYFGGAAALDGNTLVTSRMGWSLAKGAVEVVHLGPSGELGSVFCQPAMSNSTGMPGQLIAMGSSLATNNDVTFVASDLPLGVFGYLLNGTSSAAPTMPMGSQGLLCLGGSMGRYNLVSQIRNSGPQGEFSLVLDLLQTPQSGGVVPILGGQTWYFQAWYRDTDNGSPTSNLTNGVAIPFQ